MDSLAGRLLLRFDDHGDGTGKLWAQAISNGFCGEGGAWVGTEELQDFADAVSIYPLPEQEPVQISGGFFKKDLSGELEQEHLALTVYPINSTGHLGIQVRIATEIWDEERPASQHSVKLEILTSYEPLRQFSRGLKDLLAGRAKEVVLNGDA